MKGVSVENLTYCYPRAARPALTGVSLSVPAGSFVLLAGGSGSGKSTLLRAINGLIPHFYGGRLAGRVRLGELDTRSASPESLASIVGFVFQDPEGQLVMPTVEAEVAFGLQNLGLPCELMRCRVAEALQFFGLTHLKDVEVKRLSGGQKQKVALTAALAMHPAVLLLDEPTSQLDPVSAEDLFQLIKRVNEEYGTTVIMAEQRLERCLHLAEEMILLENGRLALQGSPKEVARELGRRRSFLLPPMPRLFADLALPDLPLTVKEGRELLQSSGLVGRPVTEATSEPRRRAIPNWLADWRQPDKEMSTRVENASFAYNGGREVLRGVNMELHPGEVVALMGANGAGKSTLARHLIAHLKPDRGRVLVGGRDTRRCQVEEMADLVGYLPQNPNDLIFNLTVKQELEFTLRARGLADDGRVRDTLRLLELEELADINPRDLSGGERQRVALASVLVGNQQLLVLDEPTRGLDYRHKEQLAVLLKELAIFGVTVVLITHDAGFVAECAERVFFLSDGEIVAAGTTAEVMAGFYFFAPQLHRLFAGLGRPVFTYTQARQALEEVLTTCSGRQPSSF